MDIQVSLVFPENEYWQWIEIYKEEAIPQYDENGISRHFHDIDQDNLIKFIMIHESGKQFTIPKIQDNNWRLIHFISRGRELPIMASKKELSMKFKPKSEFKYPVAGYQITKDNVNFKCLNAFLHSGDIQIIYR